MAELHCASCGGEIDPLSRVCPRCDTHVQPRTPSQSGTGAPSPADAALPEFPGYTILRSLGEGGMGAVYLAEESSLGRKVAIKVISQRVARDAQSASRFLREARTMATIEHPH